MKRAYGLIWVFTCVLLLAPAKAGAQSVPGVVSIENEVLSRYLNDSDYDTADYTYTNMDKYVPPHSGQYDKPDPVVFNWEYTSTWKEMQLEIYDLTAPEVPVARYVVPAATKTCAVYNLIPERSYAYLLLGKNFQYLFPVEEGTFFVEGRRRMLRAPYVTNIRDFGGLRTDDGRAIRFGRLYRGAAMDHIRGGVRSMIITPDGVSVFRDVMQIGADIDLRSPKELLLNDADPSNDMTNSPLGPDVEYYNFRISDFGGVRTSHMYGQPIAKIVDCLERGLNVYLHCAAGADRAGMLSFLLAAMAGVSENDLARDYELTSLAHGGSARHARNALGAYNYAPTVEYIKTNFQGRTFAEKVQNYLIAKHDVTRAQIESLQRILVE